MSPFPLFPGEMLEGVPKAIKRLPVVRENEAITLLALMEYEDEENGVTRQAGEMWQLRGPRTYIPVPEVVGSSVTRPASRAVSPSLHVLSVGCSLVCAIRRYKALPDRVSYAPTKPFA